MNYYYYERFYEELNVEDDNVYLFIFLTLIIECNYVCFGECCCISEHCKYFVYRLIALKRDKHFEMLAKMRKDGQFAKGVG